MVAFRTFNCDRLAHLCPDCHAALRSLRIPKSSGNSADCAHPIIVQSTAARPALIKLYYSDCVSVLHCGIFIFRETPSQAFDHSTLFYFNGANILPKISSSSEKKKKAENVLVRCKSFKARQALCVSRPRYKTNLA